eukprot:TRINITY_DN14610_c0_g1_i2.p1 TRINITY_DN14610_c0_g1~~TRINITY_DN14610_c0_g1_i2.p1  ORF type:complete len:401 (-),score=-21.42 TRINITY_DN14610_c0_g1_i2:128-1330(-)
MNFYLKFCLQIILEFNTKFQELTSFLIISLDHQSPVVLIPKPQKFLIFFFLRQYHCHPHLLFQKNFNFRYFRVLLVAIQYNLFHSQCFRVACNSFKIKYQVIQFFSFQLTIIIQYLLQCIQFSDHQNIYLHLNLYFFYYFQVCLLKFHSKQLNLFYVIFIYTKFLFHFPFHSFQTLNFHLPYNVQLINEMNDLKNQQRELLQLMVSSRHSILFKLKNNFIGIIPLCIVLQEIVRDNPLKLFRFNFKHRLSLPPHLLILLLNNYLIIHFFHLNSIPLMSQLQVLIIAGNKMIFLFTQLHTQEIKLIYRNQYHRQHLPPQKFLYALQRFIKLGWILLQLEKLKFYQEPSLLLCVKEYFQQQLLREHLLFQRRQGNLLIYIRVRCQDTNLQSFRIFYSFLILL